MNFVFENNKEYLPSPSSQWSKRMATERSENSGTLPHVHLVMNPETQVSHLLKSNIWIFTNIAPPIHMAPFEDRILFTETSMKVLKISNVSILNLKHKLPELLPQTDCQMYFLTNISLYLL